MHSSLATLIAVVFLIFGSSRALGIQTGDRVQCSTNGTNVRSGAGTNFSTIPGSPINSGAKGVVTNGPYTGSGFTWYQVRWDGFSQDGYTAAQFYTVVVPSAPVTTTPGSVSAPGPQINSLTPTFHWGPVLGAVGYNVYIRDTGTNVLQNFNNVTSYLGDWTPQAGTLQAGHTYKWNMVAFDSAGDSAVSNDLYFQTAPAQLPNLTPYQPQGWSNSIVISKSTGTTSTDSYLTTSDNIYVDWALVNNGQASAGQFSTRLYLDGASSPIGIWTTTSLDTNYQTYVQDLNLGALTVGQHSLELIADFGGTISESNENDNRSTVFFTISNPPSAPDLVPQNPAITTPAYSGLTCILTYTISNVGGTASVPTTTKVLIKTLAGASLSSSVFVTAAIPAISSTQESRTLSLVGIAPGDYIISIIADNFSETGQTNYTNDAITLPLKVVAALPNLATFQPAGWPDKIVLSTSSGTSIEATTATTNDDLFLDYAVFNQGMAPTTIGFQTQIKVDGVVRFTGNLPSLAPGASHTPLDVALGKLPVGNHFVSVQLDTSGAQPIGAIIEIEEVADNYYEVPITITGPPGPAVYISSPSYTGTTFSVGSQIPIVWQLSGVLTKVAAIKVTIGDTDRPSRYTLPNRSINETALDWTVPYGYITSTGSITVAALDSEGHELASRSVPFQTTAAATTAPVPHISISPDLDELPLNSTITFSAEHSTGTNNSYIWVFDDQTVLVGQVVHRTFTSNNRGGGSVTLYLNGVGSAYHRTKVFTFAGTGVKPTIALSQDPVNAATGALLSSSSLMQVAARGLNFSCQGFYSSQGYLPATADHPASTAGALGYGWTHTFEGRLDLLDENGVRTVMIHFGDGHAETYRLEDGVNWTLPAGVYSVLRENIDGSYSLTQRSQVIYHFDPTGLLLDLRDRSGNAITLVYENVAGSNPPAKRIAQAILPGGPADGSVTRSVYFLYRTEATGFLWKLRDEENHTVEFEQDPNGDLITITDENGHPIHYTYDALHQMLTGTDARGHQFVDNHYDAKRRVDLQKDADGNVTVFDYSGWPAETATGDRVTKIIRLAQPTNAVDDPDNEVTLETHDIHLMHTRHVVRIKKPSPQVGFDELVENFSYDPVTLDPLTHTDPKAQVSSNEWLNGNLTKSTARDSGITSYLYEDPANPTLPTLITFPNTKQEKRTYFANGKLKDSIFPYDPAHPDDNKTSFDYDAYGQPYSKTDKNGYTTYTHFNEWGYLWKPTDALNHDAIFEFNNVGQTRFYTNRRGLRTEFVLDNKGRTLDTIIPNPDDAALPIVLHNHYDQNDNLDLVRDSEGNETQFIHDNQDRKTKTLLPDNSITETHYDVFGYAFEAVNSFGGVTHIARDLAGRTTDITTPAPESVTTHFENDPSGNTLVTIRPSGFKTEAVFDSMDRQVEFWRHNSATVTEKTKTHFNTMAQQEWVENERGERTSFGYDDIGFQFETTPIIGPKLTFEPDKEGHTTKVTDARGNYRVDKFTKRYELEKQTDNLGNAEQFFQNEDGSLNRTINADNQETILTRNLLEQITRINPPTGPPVDFKYNKSSFRTRLDDATGTTIWTPNSLGLVEHKSQPGGLTLDFTYYPGGLEKTVTYPGGKTVTYYYDTAGRFEHMTDWAGHTWTQFYDAFGRSDYLLCPNGVKVKNGYDSEDRINAITIQRGNDPPLRVLGYTFESRGLPDSIADSAEVIPTTDPLPRTYEVDSNRLATVGGSHVAYDNRGNLLNGIVRAGATTADSFVWDYASRLISGYNAEGPFDNTYDGLGNRVATMRGATTTRFLIDDRYAMPRIMAEADAVGNTTHSYLYIGNVLVGCILPDDSVLCYHSDRQGNIILVTDGNGSIAANYNYDPFGQSIAASGSFAASNHFRYLGGLGVWDNLDGTLHARARTYCPALQRFLSQDPVLGNKQDGLSLNRYVYAGCSPTAFVDPSGLSRQAAIEQLKYNVANANSTPDVVQYRVITPEMLERIPLKPDEVDIEQNILEAESHPLDVFWFKKTVGTGGAWDYKKDGQRQYEPFGNFHYGVVGAAASIPESTLLREAGAEQILNGNSDPTWGNPGTCFYDGHACFGGVAPYGDDPNDQTLIKAGIKFYKDYESYH